MNAGQLKDELISSEPSWNVVLTEDTKTPENLIVSGNYTKVEIEIQTNTFIADFYNEAGSLEKTERYPNIKSLIPDLREFVLNRG